MIIDAWAQHPTLRHAQDEIFDSLRRWNRSQTPTEEIPVRATIQTMDAANVGKTLISAWVAPRNVMISNDEVASFVSEYPDRLVGIGSVNISKPMQAVAEIKQKALARAKQVPKSRRSVCVCPRVMSGYGGGGGYPGEGLGIHPARVGAGWYRSLGRNQ